MTQTTAQIISLHTGAAMTHTQHHPDHLTPAIALSLYDSATNLQDKVRAAAAMAHVLRNLPAPKAASKRAKAEVELSDTLNAKNLSAALARACAVIERKSCIPVVSHVRLVAKGGRLTITGTDLDIQYCETLRGEADLPDFAMCVPADGLLKALKGCTSGVAFRDETVRPEPGAMVPDYSQKRDPETGLPPNKPAEDSPFLVVSAGGMETRFTGLSAKDFPEMAERTGYLTTTVDSAAVREPLAFVESAISTEETRYYLNGAYMHVRQIDGVQKLTVVSTDGHRLLLSDTDGTIWPMGMPGVILPRKLVGFLVRQFLKPGAGDVQVDVCAEGVRFTTAQGEVVAKVIDGSFPDYCRVIPREDLATRRMVVSDTKAAAEGLKRLADQSPERGKSVRFTLAKGKVDMRVRNMEGGQADATMAKTTAEGDDGEIGFNAVYVLDALPKGETAVITMEGENCPARVTWADKPGCLGVLMPLRV